jgi:hypothetical protein
MGLGREIFGEYMRHRLYGGRHRRRGGWPLSSRYAGPFALRRPRARRRVEVRGCGCCLPIPLGLLAGTGVGLNLLSRRRSS